MEEKGRPFHHSYRSGLVFTKGRAERPISRRIINDHNKLESSHVKLRSSIMRHNPCVMVIYKLYLNWALHGHDYHYTHKPTCGAVEYQQPYLLQQQRRTIPVDTQFLQNHDNVIENSSLVVTSERKTCMSVDYRCSSARQLLNMCTASIMKYTCTYMV